MVMKKKSYTSPEFDYVYILIPDIILGSEPEGQIHENDPGVVIED